MTATKRTAFAGTLVAGDTLDHRPDPGIAPSRLKAKVMREALVRQATVQKNCPVAEISSTRKCQLSGSAWPMASSGPRVRSAQVRQKQSSRSGWRPSPLTEFC